MNFNAALPEEAQGDIDALLPAMPFDLDTAKETISRFLPELEAIRDRAQALKVVDDQTKGLAVHYGTSAKKLFQKIEKARREQVDPVNEKVRSFNNYVKTFTDPLGEIEKTTKKKCDDYDYQLMIERQRREAAARKAQQELQAKLDREAAEATEKAKEEAKAAGLQPEEVKPIEAPQVPEPVIPQAKTITRTDSGSSYQKKEWTAELQDVEKVPVEYLLRACRTKKGQEALLAVLKDAVKMGIREVAGVRIWEKPTTVFKTN